MSLSRRILIPGVILMATVTVPPAGSAEKVDGAMKWEKSGSATASLPRNPPVWLAEYGRKRVPDGKLHNLWVKVLALRDPDGCRVVLAATDHMGMSKTIYESLCERLRQHCQNALEMSPGLARQVGPFLHREGEAPKA